MHHENGRLSRKEEVDCSILCPKFRHLLCRDRDGGQLFEGIYDTPDMAAQIGVQFLLIFLPLHVPLLFLTPFFSRDLSSF